MPKVYPPSMPARARFPLTFFLRASGLHVGAAAAAASLRRDLAEEGFVTNSEFDEAYAVARITPGTNLLAMYTLLGQRLAGWRGAILALSAGAIIPAAISGFMAAVYVWNAGDPLAAKAMQGARAGALAVLLWAAIKLLRPQLTQQRVRGAILALAILTGTLALPLPPLGLLLVAGAVGAVVLRREP